MIHIKGHLCGTNFGSNLIYINIVGLRQSWKFMKQEKSANNILNAIQDAKNTNLYQFLNGLGIRNVGTHASKILEKTFNGKIEKIIGAKYEDLIDIHEIGEIMAESIIDYFNNEENVVIINRCIESGLIFNTPKNKIESQITDKVFVVTGSLKIMKRALIKEKIEEHNARLSGSISKKTDFLILGENPGSKYEKAKELNIKIINEKEFLTMLENA